MHTQPTNPTNPPPIHQDHTCPICLTVFYHPVSLPSCQHIFCQNCIMDTQILTADRRCPLCRKVFNAQHLQKAEKLWGDVQALYPSVIEEKKNLIRARKLVYLRIGNSTVVREGAEGNKFQWRLFVKTEEGEKPLGEFAKKVEVKLHPTFKPNVLIFDMNNHTQVNVARIGWGTFRIYLKVFWKDIYEEVESQFHHDLHFVPLSQNKIGCYLHEKKSQAK